MSEPRICEVLAVRVGERWDYTMRTGTKVFAKNYVLPDGVVRGEDGAPMDGMILCEMINWPDGIVRRRPYSAVEQERARAVKLIWPGANTVEREGETTLIQWETERNGETEGYTLAQIRTLLFPTLEDGEHVRLDEILEGQ